jgi:hypothetical protein
MKKLLPLFVLLTCGVLFFSCKSTWTQDDKDAFYEACMEDASPSYGPERARTYCDCVIGKIMVKYPYIGDALEHINELSADPEIRSCKPAELK